ncbi:hypothetical protein CYMTET_25649 [Cymbomonas tetramitiformis]|uniref:Large ribosomal subunit protein bL21m n=1 Tax=Cymbomonas tetramitiformis TaxID=36881 RepID=A0AAE0FTN8_9CHLO|nr:hypothetical protein CYMTET_25649 [Cymbomonas tetramitiformis]
MFGLFRSLRGPALVAQTAQQWSEPLLRFPLSCLSTLQRFGECGVPRPANISAFHAPAVELVRAPPSRLSWLNGHMFDGARQMGKMARPRPEELEVVSAISEDPEEVLTAATETFDAGEMYRVIGKIRNEEYPVDLQGKFAVVQIGAKQFKVTPDDFIYVEKLKEVDVQDKLVLPNVMLLGSQSQTIIGRPFVPGTAVVAIVEQHMRNKKVYVFKKKRRKNYRKSQGFRAQLTGLRIIEILGFEED